MTSFCAFNDSTHHGTFHLVDHPENCPECHQKIIPIISSKRLSRKGDKTFVFLSCPNPKCEISFAAEYLKQHDHYLHYFSKIIKGNVIQEKFSEQIENLSPYFIKIYNEAYFAEQNNLLEICGVGYRKALEFLIKDYIITKNPHKEDLIKKLLLGKCINEFVEDLRLKETAKRAVWLGNDHTHYVKKWATKDLSDLKLLIKLSVNWVESEIMTETLINSMTE
ncbi:DUF4145 domain-containing protein [Chryseobacterium turcicum]|uniref:DUF4145 domain-containing protein n=1 Tax=Chryseobacterium turcicum TaxID=2898076 RepID=A0A9Q3V1K4_9FLAO|nr:DUF4145 domain-containing protein [Chryseobacterium turcicum]MCD1116462.1 DUF4145 domain-containing protein [Chryseobacterium turcicum]